MRNICVLTGTRAEYGLLKPIMQAIKEYPALELTVIATGMHLSEEFGHSVDEIAKDGFEITKKVEINPDDDTEFSMATAIGTGIVGISRALKEINPDILLVLGDRMEVLAGVISAAYMNIPIAHIHGGDVTKAGLDESARHAITKFAHIHFPATEKSAERILKLGEDEWRIFPVGAPCLDTILNTKFLSKEELEKTFELDLTKPFILLIQHSVTTEPEKAEQQITETLEAIKELKYQTIIIYPNSDAGGRKIISKIKEYENIPFIKTYKNLSHMKYLSLLKFASVMVGNSSSGIIETPSFGIPAVNIGTRQDGRERACNVIDVDYKQKELEEAIKSAIEDKEVIENAKKCKNPYGNGKTGGKIAENLAKIDINKELLQKRLTY